MIGTMAINLDLFLRTVKRFNTRDRTEGMKIKLIFGVVLVWAITTNSWSQPFLANGLVAYYPLNGNVNDLSGNGNNGVVNNLISTNGNAGTPNSAFYFNGGSGYAVVPNSASLALTNISLSAWVKPDVGSGSGFIFCKHENGANSDGSWYLGVNGQLYFWAYSVLNSSGSVSQGVWSHCVFTFDSTTGNYVFYVNGQPIGQGINNFAVQSNSMPLYLGAQFNGASPDYYFQGAMDNMRIYNRVLSSSEVAQLYTYESTYPSLQITQDLTNFDDIYSENTTIFFTATSSSTLEYQWYFVPTNNIGQVAGAYAETIDGFVYGAVVTNGGFGYGNVPKVSFVGGGGAGAGGYATVSNGIVVGIAVTNAGFGYTSIPAVAIDPPNGLIFGQTNSTLTITNANHNSLGNYYVVVSNSFGSVTSSVVNLTLLFPPTIAMNPVGFTQGYHSSNTLSVAATGTPPFSYQWSLNGTNINGATSNSLFIASLNLTNAGVYTVEVMNPYGYAYSSPAYVNLSPALTSPFTGAVGLWGQDTTLGVSAIGSGSLDYQWYFDGQVILGATNSTYTLDSIQFTNAGLYNVVVSSAYGIVTNTAYQVVVNPANIALGTFPGVYITGTVGYSYTIQSTTNLADTNAWVTLTNITLTVPSQIWDDNQTDLTKPGNSQKFYRILSGQ